MAVPYIFSNTPGGSSIPLAELDANFAYVTSSPTITGNLTVNGNLTIYGVTSTGATGFGNIVFSNSPVITSPTLVTPTINGSLITGATGTGLMVLQTGATLINPNLGTPTFIDLTNATNLPVATLTGLGTGVSTGLVTNVNTANGFITYDGTLGNPNADTLVLNGSTSGTMTLKSEAVTGTNTITFPADTGTVVLQGHEDLVPPGMIMWYCVNGSPPIGWLVANGQAVSRTTYADLFATIGVSFGAGDGSTTFNVPNLTGMFIRGIGGNSAAFGVPQTDGFGSHSHVVTDPGHNHTNNDPGHTHTINDPGHVHGLNDPGHSHNVTDPTHSHTIPWPNGVAGPTIWNGGFSLIQNPPLTSTAFASTGVSVNSALCNVSMNSATTSTSNTTNATGISNNPSATGVTVGTTGTTETRPMNMALLPCIKT